MANYQDMYASLFRDVTSAVSLLKEAQRKTEDMYIEAEDPPLIVLPHPEDESPDGKE